VKSKKSSLFFDNQIDLYTYSELSELLRVPVSTLRKWVMLKSIPHIKLGTKLVRFRKRDILDWLHNSGGQQDGL